MTRFRTHDEVAVVEHDDWTREPREGGQVHVAAVAEAGKTYILVRYGTESVHAGAMDQFYSESGWRAWDGEFRWRLVPLCSRPDCGKPVLAPVSDPDDPTHQEFCSEDCLTDASERSAGAFADIVYDTEFN